MTDASNPLCECTCPTWAHQAEPPHRCGWCTCLLYRRAADR